MMGYRVPVLAGFFKHAPEPAASPYVDAPSAQPPVALAPIANTSRQLLRAYGAMIKERDELDKEIRIMAERSRQLNVSAEAVRGALITLERSVEATVAAQEVMLAEGK